jgi:hypothetical protein
MFTKTLSAIVALVAVGVVGWSVAQFQKTKFPHQGQKCKTSVPTCNIKVQVEKLCIFCDVYVDFELTEVTVDAEKKGNTITWDIADGRYEFAQDGIVFPQGSGFDCRAQNKQKFVCDNQSTPGVYKYIVKLKDLDPQDPWVVNN